ncbi:sodium/hydrogen exchanger [Desulfuromonas versatilis]|uniref:Sodium/hydrogen exchanger n=1 Tax=Desulfuromonas versatilis TaxID=2802975 RepID=A0ABN6E3W6_9BACT|nr:cation:proton antiporter [Desulfuromonas versatilis]BCR07028.1 sodium/hydrogen exchanger [Desulfuromonas versatilis]
MAAEYLHILAAIAIIFLGALIGGRAASWCRIPRVTGYLVTGLLIGPSFAHLAGLPPLLPSEALAGLRLVSDIALALILMNIGGLFELERLRRWKHRIALFSLSEMALTFTLVGLAVLVCNLVVLQTTVPGLNLWQTSLAFALLLGTIAVATAPAATLMVIREYEAEGPVTGLVLTLVGFNNLASVLGFAVVCHFLILPDEGLGTLLLGMFGPMVIGGLFGLAMALWAQRLELPSEHKVLLLGGVAAATALCRSLEMDHLLASLVLGVILANSSPRWHRLQESLRQVDYLLYVAFFVLAGANLHLETLGHIGLLGVAYVLARTLGKGLGAAIGARLGAFGQRERQYVGLALLAQAGVAIGLASKLSQQWPAGGRLLETVVLGSVVIFELVGPLAVRHGLVRAGEVPILSLLQKRAPQGTLEGMHSVAEHFRSALGLPAGHRLNDPGDILVRHVMRQNVETVRHDTPYYDLLRIIAHSRYDRFPVVDRQERFLGMINYTEIRNLLFEPSLVPLVVAGDLATAANHALGPDMPLREALKTLQLNRNISYFPVIDPADPQRLLGILSQNDVLAAFRRPESS